MIPSFLNENPFNHAMDSECSEASGITASVDILTYTNEMMTTYKVHADISKQLFSYLFFFVNVSLFNALIEKGEF